MLIAAKKMGGTYILAPPSPVRGEFELFVAAGLFHAGAHAIAAFEAHNAFVEAERKHPIPHWDCAVEWQACVFHAMPSLSVGASEHFA